MQFVELQNFEIVHTQFANFWPKTDPNPNHKPDLISNPNANPSQMEQRILQIAQAHKLCTLSMIHKDMITDPKVPNAWLSHWQGQGYGTARSLKRSWKLTMPASGLYHHAK